MRWRHHGEARGAPAYVHLVRGVWKVRCAFCPALTPWTGFGQLVCPLCGNAAAGGRWSRVVPPPAGLAEQLAPLMARRPVANRNWLHGETLDEIRAENIAHGLAA